MLFSWGRSIDVYLEAPKASLVGVQAKFGPGLPLWSCVRFIISTGNVPRPTPKSL